MNEFSLGRQEEIGRTIVDPLANSLKDLKIYNACTAVISIILVFVISLNTIRTFLGRKVERRMACDARYD